MCSSPCYSSVWKRAALIKNVIQRACRREVGERSTRPHVACNSSFRLPSFAGTNKPHSFPGGHRLHLFKLFWCQVFTLFTQQTLTLLLFNLRNLRRLIFTLLTLVLRGKVFV